MSVTPYVFSKMSKNITRKVSADTSSPQKVVDTSISSDFVDTLAQKVISTSTLQSSQLNDILPLTQNNVTLSNYEILFYNIW